MAMTKLGDKAVGSIVKLNIIGTPKNFIVVHQGKPGTMYDDSCDGTWLLTQDCYETRQWHSKNLNDYANSTIDSYLNSTLLNLFDANIRAVIKQVKIPYRPGSGISKTVNRGAEGLTVKIFLLSGTEVGIVHIYTPVLGARLSYFAGCANIGADTKRVAKLNGSASYWSLRDPSCDPDTGSAYANLVSPEGNGGSGDCSDQRGIRFAMIMPATLMVSDDGSVVANTAPTTPASITVPESIQGGSAVTISWGTSTDAESNLEGYIVERSTDGGSTWEQIYQGSGTSTANTVPFGTESVMYRVRAYDTGGLYSGYRASAQRTVINNNAPNVPTSITVPEQVMGGSELTISWGAATDPDGNLAGYSLERQVDGGSWTQVYQGTGLTYTDTITRGWTGVAYRVRAYDSYDAYGGYATSASREVNNNLAPVITCAQASGTDLGTKTEGFTVEYSANDADGDSVSITESVDGKAMRTFAATLNQSYALNLTGESFMKLLNGPHALAITASDGQASGVHTLTFTKAVTEASVTLLEPMEADAIITICVLSVTGQIPQDAQYSVKVTNNANDTEPVWEDCTTEVRNGGNHIFTNKTAANGFAFNFLVEVERGTSGTGGYINSVQGGFQ